MSAEAEIQQAKSRGHKFQPGNPWAFKPGQSGNPGGKPKGTVSIMTHVRRALAEKQKDGRTGAELLADKMLELAEAGEFKFLKEIVDRMDGPIVRETQNTNTNISTNVADMLRIAAQNQGGVAKAVDATVTDPDPVVEAPRQGGLIGMKKKKKQGST